MKILFVGAGDFPMYEGAFYNAAKEIEGVEAELYTWRKHLDSVSSQLIRKVQNKFSCGSCVNIINKELLTLCRENTYDIVFLYSCRLIYPKTVKKISEMGSYVAVYNNDDPFATYYPKYFWRHYRESIKYADIAYIYRSVNEEECKKHGAKQVKLLRSYYIKERNFYIPDRENDVEVPEVLFLGHQEQDERQEYIKALLDEKISVGVPKVVWEDFEPENPYLVKLEDTQRLYNAMLNKTKVAIVFLSKINRDTYTRRCFEIPAIKTFMVAPYTKDLATLFEEDKEVVFYRDKEEFVGKIKAYLCDEAAREQIAQNGYERVMRDGHEAVDRVKQVMRDFENCRNRKDGR